MFQGFFITLSFALNGLDNEDLDFVSGNIYLDVISE